MQHCDVLTAIKLFNFFLSVLTTFIYTLCMYSYCNVTTKQCYPVIESRNKIHDKSST